MNINTVLQLVSSAKKTLVVQFSSNQHSMCMLIKYSLLSSRNAEKMWQRKRRGIVFGTR